MRESRTNDDGIDNWQIAISIHMAPYVWCGYGDMNNKSLLKPIADLIAPPPSHPSFHIWLPKLLLIPLAEPFPGTTSTASVEGRVRKLTLSTQWQISILSKSKGCLWMESRAGCGSISTCTALYPDFGKKKKKKIICDSQGRHHIPSSDKMKRSS